MVKKIHAAIILDKSQSMMDYHTPTINAFNKILESIKVGAKENGIETTLTYTTFSNNVHMEYVCQPLSTAPALKYYNYSPSGMTALFDAVGKTISRLNSLPDAKRDDTVFYVLVITDGEDNMSPEYGGTKMSKLTELLKTVHATDRWTVLFNVPPANYRIDPVKLLEKAGIPYDNIRSWETTVTGMNETAEIVAAATTQVFDGYSKGVKMTKAAFKAVTDMSKVKVSVVKKKLEDVTSNFKAAQVDKEVTSKEFVDGRKSQTYKNGMLYYELSKREEVQGYKKFLLMERTGKTVWGGDAARDIVLPGVPAGETAKVDPGNHANWRIFVQSTAPNRKLVRGTTVLLDQTLSNDLQGTWDYQAHQV